MNKSLANVMLNKFESIDISKMTKFRVTKALTAVSDRAKWGKRLGLYVIPQSSNKKVLEITSFENMSLLIEWSSTRGTILSACPIKMTSKPIGKDVKIDSNKDVYLKDQKFTAISSDSLKELAKEFGKDSVSSNSVEIPFSDNPVKPVTKTVKTGDFAEVQGPDGKKVKVYAGDYVHFKSDFEQSGTVTKIKKGRLDDILTIKSSDSEGFEGDYIGGQEYTNEMASDCWIE